MKRLCLILISILPAFAIAQSTDYNKIILPENVRPNSFEEKLVQLAWKNNPQNRIVNHNVIRLSKEKNLAKYSWLNNISGVANVNEFTLNPSADVFGRASFYPKYNLSVRVTLATLFLTPTETKIANEKVIVGEEQVNLQKLKIRGDVLKAFEVVKENYKVYRLRVNLEEDFLLIYRESEKKFSLGQIQIDEYRQASQSFYSQTEAVISAKSEFNQSKIDLEVLVGLILEDIEGYTEFLTGLNEEIKRN